MYNFIVVYTAFHDQANKDFIYHKFFKNEKDAIDFYYDIKDSWYTQIIDMVDMIDMIDIK